MIPTTVRFATALAAAALLAAAPGASAAEKGAKPGMGWVVFSALTPTKGVAIMTVRLAGSKKDIEVQAGSGMGVFSKSDFTDSTPPPALTGPLHDEGGFEYDPVGVGQFGVAGARPLPAGDYTVTRIVLDLGGLRGGWEYKDVSIPFHVAEGRATYLGAYRFLGLKRNGAGLLKLFPYRVVVRDQHERDLRFAKLPAGVALDLAIPDVEAWQRPEFASKP